jgi:hypothetical protein
MIERDNPRTHMQTMPRVEERRGTNWTFAGAAVLAIVIGVGLLAWLLVPGLGAPNAPKNAGTLSNQTVGVSVASKETEPLRTSSPNSTDGDTVTRNQAISHTEKPNLSPLSKPQRDAIQNYVSSHPQQVMPQTNFSIVVGGAVPDSAKLTDMPQQVAQALPNYASDQFFVVNNQFVVVERQTRRIVAIVPVSNEKGQGQ